MEYPLNRSLRSFAFLVPLAVLSASQGCAESEDEPGTPVTTHKDSGSKDTSSPPIDEDGSDEDAGTDEGEDDAATDAPIAPKTCGNAAIDKNETCDDGNGAAGDGCSETCVVETGFVCTGAGAASCAAVCGNAVVESREACDLGALDAGLISPGCTATCSLAEGWSCTGTSCAALCGDGKKLGAEVCDDGAFNGDPGRCNKTCSGAVAASCGDGFLQAGEGCDDGALNGTAGKCAAGCPVATALLPAQNGTFGTNARGYYFTAPKDFVITTIEVPTDASTGSQSVAIVRLTATPAIYPAFSSSFQTLYYSANAVETGPIPVKIPISKNEIIGVLGVRNDQNSYGNGPHVSSILGSAVTFARLGMQSPLSTTSPKELWTESGTDKDISRVTLGVALPQCGDGVKVASEACDDGNFRDGDGCSSACKVESGFNCSNGTLTASTCTSTCGDTVRTPNEGCDNGSNNGKAGFCDSLCIGLAAPMGTEASTAAGSTRGFWFIAPGDFSIRGLRVPATAGTAAQAVEVVKFFAAPPAGGAITNNFQSLTYARDVVGTGFIKVSVAIKAGDIIGVLGSRGTGVAAVTSMSSAPIPSIVGNNLNVTLNPLASAGPLASGNAFNLTGSVAGATGRVELLDTF